MDNLYTAFSDFDDGLSKRAKTYSGILGLPTSNKTVDVPGRNGYVYVRLRDNQNEIIQAFNEKVSAVYNLPVLVTRQGNRWTIVGRDIDRYENWGSYSAFLPAHAHQHEFDRNNPGGDVVFSYIDQLMPLLVYPSGTPGSPNVLVGGYSFKKNDSTWAYVGNTGTSSVLVYKPVDNQARMVLIYLDRNTGNPGMLVNSGTSFAANLTGTHDVIQYLPSLTSTQEPLKAIRLVSGTEYVGWENLYDIRQFLGGTVTGTGGGSTTPGGSNTQIQYNDNNAFNGDSGLVWYETENCLIVGDGNAPPAVGTNSIHLLSDTTSPGFYLWAASSNFSVAPFISGLRGRGTIASPSAIQASDYIFRLRARAHDGTEWTGTQAEILFDVPHNWISGSHSTEISAWVTPSGTAVMEEILRIKSSGINVTSTKHISIGGDRLTEGDGWIPVDHTWTFASADDPTYQIYVSGDITSDPDYKAGNKVTCTTTGTFNGFITKVGSYDSGNNRTPVDVYGGTDYDLANLTITSPKISKVKSPDGFPISPAKWTVTTSDTSNAAQATPSASTWYNLGSISINIPIGVWDVYYQAVNEVTLTLAAVTSIAMRTTLSTANNSESDNTNTSSQGSTIPIVTGGILRLTQVITKKALSLTTKTTYYLNSFYGSSGATSLNFRGDLAPTVIRAVCAYL